MNISLFHRSLLLFLLFCSFAMVLPQAMEAQLVNGRLISSVYTWEKFDTVGVSKKFARGFQSVLLDIGQGDFSVHTHVQGAVMLQKKLDELPDMRLWYLYAQWKKAAGVADFSAGRMPYFVGVGSGTMDGVRMSLYTIGDQYRLTAYGGANAPVDLGFDTRSLKRDFSAGGQLLVRAIPHTRLGLSYMNRQRERESYRAQRADSLFNPHTIDIFPSAQKEQYAGADISCQVSDIRFFARYEHDLNQGKIQKAQGGFRYDLNEFWTVTADFIHREPRIPFHSFFALFDIGKTDELEAGADYRFHPQLRVFARAAEVQYNGEESIRWTAGLAHEYASLTYRGNSGYAGELTSFSADLAFPLWENIVTPSAGLSYSSYKLNTAAKREEVFAAVAGSTLRPIQQVSVDLQGQWVRNRVVQSDFRFFGRLSFWFSEQLHLFP